MLITELLPVRLVLVTRTGLFFLPVVKESPFKRAVIVLQLAAQLGIRTSTNR